MRGTSLIAVAVVLVAVAASALGQEDALPASDPGNIGRWALREDMSDEFEGASLDTDKWRVSGTGGWFMVSWPGRAPSQFAPENVRVEDGKLKLTTKWDPGYDFVDQNDPDSDYDYGDPPYTTAAVITNNTLRYGYMEIMCKAADVSITSSFWATGNSSELDVFEFVADSKTGDADRTFPFCVHNWDMGGDSWCDSVELDWRVGEEFHVYGCEWDADGLKFYADGELVRDAPASEMRDIWNLDEQMHIWVDSETFFWQGFPDETELPADYEIEYIRVWEQHIGPVTHGTPTANLIGFAMAVAACTLGGGLVLKRKR